MKKLTEEKIILNKVIEWLQEEVNLNQDIVEAHDNNDDDITTSGDDDICYGRHECAKGLLNQIEKWSKEWKN
mgnify:CR=1 FL=1